MNDNSMLVSRVYLRHFLEECSFLVWFALLTTIVYSNGYVYGFLLVYFTENFAARDVEEDIREKLLSVPDERRIRAELMVSWIPYEKNRGKILQTIRELMRACK